MSDSSIRIPIPPSIAEVVLVEARYRCCICPEHRREVQIHHINHDPSDNSYDNLVAVCANCHADIHTKGELYRNLTPRSLRTFKEEWKTACRDYEKMMVSHVRGFQHIYFFNVPWILRILHELVDESLFTSPIMELLTTSPFLFGDASKLTFQEHMVAALYLEKAVSAIVERCDPVFLDDVVERSVHSASIGSGYVIFHHDFYGKGLPPQTIDVDASYSKTALLYRKGNVGDVKYRAEMIYDPRYLFSSTSFINMQGRGVRSGLGLIVGAITSESGVHLKIRPLAIGSSGPRLDRLPFTNAMFYTEFKKYRDDMVAYLQAKRQSGR